MFVKLKFTIIHQKDVSKGSEHSLQKWVELLPRPCKLTPRSRFLGTFSDVQRAGRANADDLVDEASAWTCSFAVPVLLFVRFAFQFVDKMPRALGHREFGEYVLRCFESHLSSSCGTTHKIYLAPYRQHACKAACVHKCILVLLRILYVMRTLAWWRCSA